MTIFDEQTFTKEKNEAVKFYNSLKPIVCPVINEMIYFTSEGFNHLIFKGARRERPKPDQFMRYKLIEHISELISKSHTMQDYDCIYKQVEIKIKKRKTTVTKKIQYWGLLGIIRKRRLKVVLKKSGNSKVIFWSVIPKWKTNKFGGIVVRSIATGDLEEE